jgi:PKD repeat protein
MLNHSAPIRIGMFCCWILARSFFGSVAFGQVTADFSSTTQAGCSPLTVQFFNAATGPVVSYLWNFGNGNTSTLPNPGVIYINPGTYTVSLTVSDGTTSVTEIKTAYVTVFADPVPNLLALPASGCTPLSVSFTDQSTPGDAPINSWTWDFGDGNISNLQNPNHLYSVSGNYDLTLVVTDTNGCSGSLTLPGHINSADAVNASFSSTAANPCLLPHSYFFTSSVTPSASYTYAWDFGDGNTSTLANPSHTYASAGNYPVMLIVDDPNGGCPDTVVQNLAVQLQTPNANFTLSDTLACVGQALSFSNLSTGASNFFWDFGDGSTFTGPSAVHAYTNPGTYTVSLIASSAAGCADTLVRSAYVQVQPSPAASFVSTDPSDCQALLIVDFTDASQNATSWNWDFGDGATASAPSPSHVYTAPGLYDVQLIVGNSFGCADTLLQPNYVQIIPPVAAFIADTIEGCVPLNVDFLDLSTTVFDSIDTWIWNFGDGGNSFLQNPSYTYTNAGQYDVTLTVQTTTGCTDTAVFSMIQAGIKPVIDFTANPLIVCAEDPVSFQDMSSIGTNFTWDFGDGNGGFGPNPTHFYADTGLFTVSLIVSHFGCRDTLVKPDFIRVLGPIAEFTQTPDVGCEIPLSVAFFDQSTDPHHWFWDFGDGTTDTVQNPSHVYNNLGTYTITLVVTNDSTGCTDDYSQDLDIFPPTAAFSVSQTTGCTGLPVSFINTSVNASIFFWDFGDGNTSTAPTPNHNYTSAGIFDVTLIASSPGGCADTLVSPALINIVGPTAQFQADTTTGCAPLAIYFSDLSTATPTSTFITGWQWDFGDGGTSFSQNPIYTYNQPGSYDVTLTVVDNQGCADSVTFLNYINPTFPTAAFTTADSISCPGALVSFSNLSTGVGNSYLWDFGDGNISSAVNPVHVFPPTGTYTISLTATDVNGCVSTSIMQDLVSIGLPTADFFASPTQQACPPLAVNFTDLSSPQVTSWFWDFGDGSTSTLANPGKVYNIPGTFDVSLVVTTAQGCSDTLFMPSLINLSGPTGNFSFGPIAGCNPLTVNFAASTDSAVSWTWDFGDGSLGFGQTTSHTYTSDTIAFPLLLIQDTAGCTVAIPSQDSVVSLPGPNPAFMSSNMDLCLGDAVLFTNTSTSVTPIVSYQWDFGDGTSSSASDPLHTYTSSGVFTPTLIATNGDGCVDSISSLVPITVSVPPDAFFTPSTYSGCAPLQVSFADSSIAGTGLTRFWDFGDGNTATTQVPLHTYATPGTYTVKLLITDGNGCQDSAFQTINVFDGPLVDFNAAPTTGCAPKNVQFVSLATGSASLSTWFWDFGDGTTSTLENPTHVYTSNGQFDVSLTVTDVNGCTDTYLQPDLIDLVLPTANFTSNAAPSCPDQTVIFSPSITSVHPIANWYWDFGDGANSLLSNPVHVYDSPGVYDVSLIIVDALGCSDTLVDPQHVTVYAPPVADFQADSIFCLPGLLSAVDQSIAGSSPITSYLYDFGNGTTSGNANASVSYASPGSYSLSLIVSDLFGCADTALQNVTVYPGVTAAFSVQNPIGCANTAVNFLDLSTGANPPISWQWDFGDGTGSALQFPAHTYSGNGVYSVSLVVEDVNGCQDTATQSNVVNLTGPVADFTLSSAATCPGAIVGFTDASLPDTTLNSWLWDFGDGTTSSLQSPVHSYSSPGTYNVSLTIGNVVGCNDTEVKTAVITVIPPPTAAIAMDDSLGCAPMVVQFADSSTSGVNITGWNWDFGNGNSSIFPAPTQVFSAAGVYNISLTVTDANGCIDTTSLPLVVTDGPVVDFQASDTTGCASKVVSFVDLSTGSNNIVSWDWSFGDGSSSASQSPVHTYLSNGSFTVSLAVTDAGGCTDSLTKLQYIQLEQPQPDFTINTDQACPGFTFGFNDLSVADTTITSWFWDFGDGSTGSGPNPSHTYADTGFYSVSLTITDLFGCSETIVKADTVGVLSPPTAQFLMPSDADCSPFVAQFFDASLPANGSPIVAWDWNLGNGNTSNFPNANSTYTAPGFYPVSLTITDANGCVDSMQDTVQVYFPPQANFLASTQILCENDTVNFVDVSTGVASVVSWFWDFGDGNGSNLQSPSHSYNAVGTYTVSLITLDANGCADTLIRPNYIEVTRPTADFTLDEDSDCPGVTVSFNDISLPDTTLTAWFWDFGDGNTSNLLQPNHVYTTPGTFTVSLTVTNLLGCQDTESKVDTITVFDPPAPAFTPSDTAACAPVSVVFLDNSTGMVPLQTWQWNFGDGSGSTSVNPSHAFQNPGLYTVQLVVSDANGCVDSTQQDIEVYALPQANFVASDTVGCAPDVVLFTDLSFPAPVSWGLELWRWRYGQCAESGSYLRQHRFLYG